MAYVNAESRIEEAPSIRGHVVDEGREAHVSPEARLLKAMAEDVLEHGLYAAKQAERSGRRRAADLGDLKYEGAHRLRHRFLFAMASALGVGVALGVAATIAFGRVGLRTRTPTQRR